MITEWTESNKRLFDEAIDHIREQLAGGGSRVGAIEHTGALYGISQDALEHECDLREVYAQDSDRIDIDPLHVHDL